MLWLPPTVIVGVLLLGACTTVPVGPNVMAMPGSGRNFEAFRRDDLDCRNFATAQVGGQNVNQAAADAGVASAVTGAVVGALAGAAIDGSHGAGVGAGTGLIFGSMAGAGAASESAYITQQRYDTAYVQCMYAQGHRVPVSGGFVGGTSSRRSSPASPRTTYPPPPPPGSPPPPPQAIVPR